MDQLLAINQMMEATGQKSEAPILRDLVDEGLIARRRKAAGSEVSEQPVPVVSVQELAQTLETNQTLLLRIIEQGHSAFRMHRASLELSQEAIVEARTGKIWSWETLVTSLREGGSSAQQIADLLEEKTEESKGYAYGLAEEIRINLMRRRGIQRMLRLMMMIGRGGWYTIIATLLKIHTRTSSKSRLAWGVVRYMQIPCYVLHTDKLLFSRQIKPASSSWTYKTLLLEGQILKSR